MSAQIVKAVSPQTLRLQRSEDFLEEYLQWDSLDVNENANRYQGPSGFFAYMLERFMSGAVPELLPADLYRAHQEGLIYIHKLPLSLYLPYCTGHSLERLLRLGLRTPVVSSRPARHFDTYVDHIANFLITAQHYFTGAQALSAVEWYAGPFIREDGLSPGGVRQNVQRLVYNLNYPSRVGFQTPFTNFTAVMDAPRKMLESERAVRGGVEEGQLGAYEREAKMFLTALSQVLLEGDVRGVPFTFPIPTLMTTAKMLEEPEVFEAVFTTAARRGSFYWLNTRVVDPESMMAMCLHESERVIARVNGRVEVITMGELFRKYAGELESRDPDGAEWYRPRERVEVLAFDPSTAKVEWRPVRRILVKRAARAVRVTLSNNMSFIVTHDHPILVYRKDTRRLYLRTAGDLLKLKQPHVLKVPVLLAPVEGVNGYITLEDKEEKIKIVVDEQFAYFLGLYYADGTLIRYHRDDPSLRAENDSLLCGEHYIRGVQFSLGRDETQLIEFVKSYARRQRWSVSEYDDKRWPSVHYIQIYSARLGRMLCKLGISAYSDEKRIPWFIYSSPPSVRLSFLKGLLEGDGYFRRNSMNKDRAHYELHIKNKELAADVVLLAHMCGVPAYLRVYKDSSVTVWIPARPDGEFERDVINGPAHRYHMRAGDVAWCNIYSVEEIAFETEQLFVDVEIEGLHYFVHSLGVITHNCCRLTIERNDVVRANSKAARISLRRDLDSAREEWLGELVRRRRGGTWAIPDVTGSIGVIDVNLPRLALASRDDAEFWENFDRALGLVRRGLALFRRRYERLAGTGMFSFLREYLPEFPLTHFNTIGLIGLPEAAAIYMRRPDLWTEGSRRDWLEAAGWMREVVAFAAKRAREWMEEDRTPWNVEEVPGESAAVKLAMKDLQDFPELAQYLREPVYSSSVAPYYAPMELYDRVEVEARVQREFTGGVMMHVFLGEEPDPEALAKLVRRLTETDLVYWSFTPAQTHCPKCGKTFTGLYTACPECGHEGVEVWSRIVGYYRPLRNWNPARRKEFWTRRHYTL